MKTLALVLLLFTASTTFCQSDEDYQAVVSKVTESYNSKNIASIHELFSTELQQSLTIEALTSLIDESHTKRGAFENSSLLMEDESGVRFLVQFEKKDSILVLLLNAEGKLTIFQFEEY